MLDIRRVIATAGGPARVGKECGVTSQAVSQWKKVPLVHLGKVAALAGMPARKLRPDLWEAMESGEKKAV